MKLTDHLNKSEISRLMNRPELATVSGSVIEMNDSQSQYFMVAVISDNQVTQVFMNDRGFGDLDHSGPSEYQLSCLKKLLKKRGVTVPSEYNVVKTGVLKFLL